MLELREWIRAARFDDRPWLVLGKGPTFDRRDEVALADYQVLSLNHAVREVDVDVAHVVDIDVVVQCADVLEARCRWLVMPRHPHVAQQAGVARLEDYLPHVPVLRRLDELGRLVWYNAETGEPVGDSPVMSLKNFSSEAALDILGEMGATTVRSLGIDGGVSYGSGFDRATLLANGQPTFDVQFEELRRISERRGIDYRPVIDPIRVFIGVDETQLVAARVLEHSIRQHASRPVVVHHLSEPPARLPRDKANQPRTAFSFSRFRIPELAGFRGRAIYLDADMLVFGDIAELDELPFGGAQVLCSRQDEPPSSWVGHEGFHPGRQFSVMVIDCERARWDLEEIVDRLDAGSLTYEELMFDLAIVPPEEIGEGVPGTWNHLEQFVPAETKLLHYTVVPTQPWKSSGNALGDLWSVAYARAVAARAVPIDEVARAIAKGWLRREFAEVVFTRPTQPPAKPGASPAEVELLALRASIASGEEKRRQLTSIAKRLRRPGELPALVARWMNRRRSGVKVADM